jgi:phenylpropionate dioxygenase-like ring-hydroxylating dioxygenase large terminal subunit
MNRQEIGNVAEILLEYFDKNETFQTDKLMTVPAESYVDFDQLSTEIALIFKRLPLMLALSCEMPKPGDYKAIEVVGLPVLIARDREGTVRAFFNVCAHRWAPVAREGLGNCAHFRFVCPFHGWTYGADGKLIGVADRAKFGDIDQSTHGLKELPCEERHGMIFVCLTRGITLDLGSYYGALLEDVAYFQLQDWHFLGSTVLEGPNWKLILANFFESYHIAAQHPRTLAPQLVSNLNYYEAFGPNMRIAFSLRTIAKLREIPRAQWNQEAGEVFVFMRHFFPNVTCTIFPHDLTSGVSSFIQILPGPTPESSRVVRLSLRKPKPGDDREKVENDFKANVQLANDIVRDEDFATAFATQKGLRSGAYEGLLYGRNERGPQYLHEWVNWYLQDNPTLPKPVL